ncbi:hypothetical protein BH09ACT12_BH09ACT12_26080 [soil metagenome]
MTIVEPSPEQSRADSPRPRWAALLAVAVVAVAAILAAVVVIGGEGPAAAAPLSQVKASCTDWMGSASTGVKPDDQWCNDMFAWMGDSGSGNSMMGDSDNSMMGNMMWQSSDQMGLACREWVSAERGQNGDTGVATCDAMIEWMDGHMSSQDGHWMMQNR